MAITLPTADDLKLIYGSANINAWACVENDEDRTKIQEKIEWSINESYRYIYQRLAVYFDVELWVELPAEVKSLITRHAGIQLYAAPRGLSDGSEAAKLLSRVSLEIEAKLEQILAGQVRLLDVPTESAPCNLPNANNSTACFIWDERRARQQRTGEPVLTDDMNFYRS
jgi:hypothetical protein